MQIPNKRNLVAVALFSALASSATSFAAQDATNAVAIPKPAESQERPAYRPWTVGLEAGTTGAGGSVSWRFADHFGARAGLDYLQYSDGGLVIKSLTYDAKVRLMSEPLTLDIYPWEKHSFHISVGMMFNQNRLTGTATDGGTLIPPDSLGTLNLKVEQQPVNPYLSVGGTLFYFDHAHHWAMGGELGVVYTGDPQISLTSSRSGPAIDRALRAEESRIEDYASRFKWWPVVKLGVSYSF